MGGQSIRSTLLDVGGGITMLYQLWSKEIILIEERLLLKVRIGLHPLGHLYPLPKKAQKQDRKPLPKFYFFQIPLSFQIAAIHSIWTWYLFEQQWLISWHNRIFYGTGWIWHIQIKNISVIHIYSISNTFIKKLLSQHCCV